MPAYIAPLTDIRFLINDVFDFQKHYSSIQGGSEASPETIDAILDYCTK